MTEEQYRRKFQKIAGIGRLIVRDFPTGTAHTGHFRSYLAELKEKSAFVPDVIVVDYLNICSSERTNSGGNTPQYQVIGSIAKELRALAQQNDAVLWTATQANRSGLKGPVDLTNTSDSIQISYDADLVLSMWKDETLADYLHVSISKHRNGGSAGKHGMLVVNTSKMKLHDMNEADATEFEKVKETYSKSKGKKAPTPVFDIDR